MSCFSRDVLRWLQSLDLSVQIRNPKWDFSNGYVVAEILAWYFSKEISLHRFINGTAFDIKLKNWNLLKYFFEENTFGIQETLIDGTLYCKEDAAILLVNRLYEILTLKSPTIHCTGNLNDSDYQQSLPLHARSTAAKALKNNLNSNELVAEQDIVTNQQKASVVLQRHLEVRASERREQPDQFGRRPTPGERCLRQHPGDVELAVGGSGSVRSNETRVGYAILAPYSRQQSSTHAMQGGIEIKVSQKSRYSQRAVAFSDAMEMETVD